MRNYLAITDFLLLQLVLLALIGTE